MVGGDLLRALEDAVARLTRLGVSYMVTGSLALAYYVEPRMTRDIDMVIDLADFDPETFIQAFREGYYVPEELVRTSTEPGAMFNIIREDSVVKIDLVVRREGEFREMEFSRRRLVQIGTVRCFVVSPEDLILAKLIWSEESHSPVQLQDVALLVRMSDLDRSYLDVWAGRLGVDELLRGLDGEA